MGIVSMIAKAALGEAAGSDGNKAKIVITDEDGNETDSIPVQFNPSQYTITDRPVYSERARSKEDEPAVNYNGSQLSTLSVQLVFNSAEFTSVESVVGSVKSFLTGAEAKDITEMIDKITDLTRIDGDKHKPPNCTFVWGSLFFVGHVESVGVTYTMFDQSGKPISATVNLTMRGFNDPPSDRKSPKQSPDRSKSRIMTEDTNIWGMAAREYGDPGEWRRIAEANDIMNPLDIPVGTVLRVPSINE